MTHLADLDWQALPMFLFLSRHSLYFLYHPCYRSNKHNWRFSSIFHVIPFPNTSNQHGRDTADK